MNNYKASALLVSVLCAGCATSYIPPTEHPPLMWEGRSGWRLDGDSARVSEGVHQIGEPFLEHDAYLVRTGIVQETVQMKNAYGRDLIIPQGTKAFAMNFTLVTGYAQVGVSGLSRVQVWLQREGEELAEPGVYFSNAPWTDAEILPPPESWGGGLEGGRIPASTLGFDSATGGPLTWPLHTSLLLAKEFAYTGDRISAARAAQIGLANHVCPDGEVMNAALAAAKKIAALPPQAVQATKRVLNLHVERAVLATIDFAMSAETESFDTPELRANVERFLRRS